MANSTPRTRDLTDQGWTLQAPAMRDQSFEQSLAYSRAAAARIGAGLRLVAVERGDELLALAAFRIKTVPGLRRGIAWCPGGPLIRPPQGPGPDQAALETVLATLRARFCEDEGHVLRLRLPAIEAVDPAMAQAALAAEGFAPTARAPAYRSFALDLRFDQDALMARLNGKWRTDLRFALKSGLGRDHATSRSGLDPALIARFMALYGAVQDAKGFRPEITPEFHFGLTDGAAGAEDYRLDILIATKDGQDVAGIVLGTAGACTTYLFGATADAGRPLKAGYFLQWEGLALARHIGSAWYDLGGVDFEANPDVARFKERMGGVLISADPHEARPGGLFPKLLDGLEGVRARIRKAGR